MLRLNEIIRPWHIFISDYYPRGLLLTVILYYIVLYCIVLYCIVLYYRLGQISENVNSGGISCLRLANNILKRIYVF